MRGWDIESDDDGGLVAEVFSSVSSANNRKLALDVERVGRARTAHQYIFFMCPGIESGPFDYSRAPADVAVWSLAAASVACGVTEDICLVRVEQKGVQS